MLLFWEPIIWLNFELLDFLDLNYMSYINNLIDLLHVGYIIFFIGIFGIIIKKDSIIYMLMSIELIFLGLNVLFLSIGSINLILQIPIFVLLILTLSAAETAIILALIFLYHKQYESTSIIFLMKLKF